MTTSTTFGPLATPGPSVTVEVPASGDVLISVTAAMIGNAASTSCEMSFTVSGASTRPASDATVVVLAAQTLQRASATSLLTGLTPGTTTFTAVYRAEGQGSLDCTFSDRTIVVLPLT